MEEHDGNVRSFRPPTPSFHINDLPYDIMYAIFVACWNEARKEKTEWDRRRIPHWPVIASHVCRLWRQYSLDTPAFWSYLIFAETVPQLVMYQEWLSRLKNAPFDVCIDWKPFTVSSIKHAKGIMRLIMPHISNLRSLNVNFVPAKILRLIFDRLSDANMPSLEKLGVVRLRNSDDDLPEPSRKKIRFKPFLRAQAPALKEVDLSGLPHEYITGRFRETLRVFKTYPRINVRTPRECAKLVQEILSQVPGLRVFGLSHAPSRSFGYRELEHTQHLQSPPLPLVRHTSLQEIAILAGVAFRDMIICSLALPHVRYFTDEHREEIALGIGCLQYLELGPFPSLISLRLRGSWDMSGQPDPGRDPRNSRNLAHLLPALELLPQLRSLTLENVDFEHNEYLLKCLRTAECCPMLQWLALLQCVGYKMQELRVIVETRQKLKNANPLRQITVYEWPASDSIAPDDQESRDWLGEAVEFRVATTAYDDRQGQNYLRVVEGITRERVL